ncbi:unnamed protein product [Brassicogethes aeneus]|uniref:RING-type E3 ubiquitin transferase n=1 Tax=Brassicogethes aeneus TaxID=1431903 RepID=A0A9P0FAH2_BRAAE|nr:unnamed protein product [Brassicogethes aeneus]
MANETINQFTDDLLSEKLFNCQICDEICTSDIFLVKGKGNVCAVCFEENCGEEIKSRAELNTVPMSIIAKLMLPCKFQAKGCDKRLASNNYSKHISTCYFKIKPCPMKNLEGCDWSGSTFEFSGHLLNNHQEHVVKSGNNIFKVETSLLKPFNVKLLSDDHQNCILKTSVVDNKFYYALNPLEKSEENVEFSVVHKSIPTPNHLVKTVGTLTKLNGFYDEENLDKNPNATVVDIDLLKQLADQKNMISNEFNLNPKGIDEDMLKLLECPVCMSVMRPPIYQCKRGHSICIICRGKVSACPTCKGEWTTARNFFIENFTANVKYPCKFKKNGCKEIGVEGEIKKHEEMCNNSGSNKTAVEEFRKKCMGEGSLKGCCFYDFGCKERGVDSEIIKHEESCGFYRYKCPLCPEFVAKNGIIQHAKEKHKITDTIPLNQIGKSLAECMRYIVFDLKLFRISYYTEDVYIYFAVELICSNENPSLYTYQIAFQNSFKKFERPLILEYPCLKERAQTPWLKIKGDVIILATDYIYFAVSIKKKN